MDQIELFSDNPEYDAFVAKFKPKKTTDDCYTPEPIYNVVRDWACERYGIDPDKIVRPFYPGGDYENFPYPDGAVVLDNPPFSILSKICEFYLDRGIPFFLFAPSLTAFSGKKNVLRLNHIICDARITYDNGAVINTAFITTYGGDVIVQTAPDLRKLVEDATLKAKREKTKRLPKYVYPDHVLTAAMLRRYSLRGVDFCVRRGECTAVSRLDAQRPHNRGIFGGGLLLSQKAAARKAAAEKAAAEKAAAEKAAAEKAAAIIWELSAREKRIIESLDAK